MNIQGSEAAQKENKKSLENILKDMEVSDLNDRKFKIAVLKKFNKMQKNTNQQIN